MTKGVMRERHAPLTEEELDAVTVVFHQFETGLREGTIYTKVRLHKFGARQSTFKNKTTKQLSFVVYRTQKASLTVEFNEKIRQYPLLAKTLSLTE
jgi:hypothetical protein